MRSFFDTYALIDDRWQFHDRRIDTDPAATVACARVLVNGGTASGVRVVQEVMNPTDRSFQNTLIYEEHASGGADSLSAGVAMDVSPVALPRTPDGAHRSPSGTHRRNPLRPRQPTKPRAFFAIIESRKSAIALRTHTNFVHGCFRWHANSSSAVSGPTETAGSGRRLGLTRGKARGRQTLGFTQGKAPEHEIGMERQWDSVLPRPDNRGKRSRNAAAAKSTDPDIHDLTDEALEVQAHIASRNAPADAHLTARQTPRPPGPPAHPADMRTPPGQTQPGNSDQSHVLSQRRRRALLAVGFLAPTMVATGAVAAHPDLVTETLKAVLVDAHVLIGLAVGVTGCVGLGWLHSVNRRIREARADAAARETVLSPSDFTTPPPPLPPDEGSDDTAVGIADPSSRFDTVRQEPLNPTREVEAGDPTPAAVRSARTSARPHAVETPRCSASFWGGLDAGTGIPQNEEDPDPFVAAMQTPWPEPDASAIAPSRSAPPATTATEGPIPWEIADTGGLMPEPDDAPVSEPVTARSALSPVVFGPEAAALADAFIPPAPFTRADSTALKAALDVKRKPEPDLSPIDKERIGATSGGTAATGSEADPSSDIPAPIDRDHRRRHPSGVPAIAEPTPPPDTAAIDPEDSPLDLTPYLYVVSVEPTAPKPAVPKPARPDPDAGAPEQPTVTADSAESRDTREDGTVFADIPAGAAPDDATRDILAFLAATLHHASQAGAAGGRIGFDAQTRRGCALFFAGALSIYVQDKAIGRMRRRAILATGLRLLFGNSEEADCFAETLNDNLKDPRAQALHRAGVHAMALWMDERRDARSHAYHELIDGLTAWRQPDRRDGVAVVGLCTAAVPGRGGRLDGPDPIHAHKAAALHNDLVRAAIRYQQGRSASRGKGMIFSTFDTPAAGLTAAVAIMRAIRLHNASNPDSPVISAAAVGVSTCMDGDLEATRTRLRDEISGLCADALPEQIVVTRALRKAARYEPFAFADNAGRVKAPGRSERTRTFLLDWSPEDAETRAAE